MTLVTLTQFFYQITYDKNSDEFRYILTGDHSRLWDDRNTIYHEAYRKCYQFHNATNSLMAINVEHCPMGTRSLLYKNKVLRPNEKWTNGNKTEVTDTQVNQSQWEEPVDYFTDTRMTVVSPGVYGHHQFTAVEQQEMAFLKIKPGLKSLRNPRPNTFLSS